jgi:hypothetical protein
MSHEPSQPTAEQRLVSSLEERGFVTRGRSKWGEPALRTIPAGHEPQRTKDSSALQRRFVACAYATPSPGDGLCASWVEQAFSRLGIGVVLGDAAHLYQSYCHYDDPADLLVGMIVAVPRHPYSVQGTIHGHVGLYIGDDTVMDSLDGRTRTVPLILWLSTYGLMAPPRWGWLGSMGLT